MEGKIFLKYFPKNSENCQIWLKYFRIFLKNDQNMLKYAFIPKYAIIFSEFYATYNRVRCSVSDEPLKNMLGSIILSSSDHALEIFHIL